MITEEEKEKIFKLFEQGFSIRKICRLMNLKYSQVERLSRAYRLRKKAERVLKIKEGR